MPARRTPYLDVPPRTVNNPELGTIEIRSAGYARHPRVEIDSGHDLSLT